MEETTVVSLGPREISRSNETQPAPPSSGTRALMVAVLEDAIHSLSSSQRLVRAEAELWITSRERRHTFSFVVVCEALDLEPSAVRRSVVALLAKKHTRGRLLKRSRSNIRRKAALRVARGPQPSNSRVLSLRR